MSPEGGRIASTLELRRAQLRGFCTPTIRSNSTPAVSKPSRGSDRLRTNELSFRRWSTSRRLFVVWLAERSGLFANRA